MRCESLDELDQSFAEGGEEVLDLAMERYGQPLLRYCMGILCQEQDAQDVVQATFWKAYQRRSRFQKGTSLSAWLYRIAYTTSIDLLRRRRVQSLFFPPPERPETEPMDETLREALLALTPRERALVLGRVLEEKSYEQLAEIFQAPPATLRKRYERAKHKLAKLLTEAQTEKP